MKQYTKEQKALFAEMLASTEASDLRSIARDKEEDVRAARKAIDEDIVKSEKNIFKFVTAFVTREIRNIKEAHNGASFGGEYVIVVNPADIKAARIKFKRTRKGKKDRKGIVAMYKANKDKATVENLLMVSNK